MARVRDRESEDDAESGGRWQRRAARAAAERRRVPKHGKGYVTLAEQMLARRAGGAGAPRSGRRRPRPEEAEPPTTP